MRVSSVLVIALLLCCSSLESFAETDAEDGATLAEKQYKKAVELRSRKGVSGKQLKHAASLLKAAAGVSVADDGAQPAKNVLLPHTNTTELYPGLHVASGTHIPALKLLSKLYFQDTQGLPLNPRAAFALLNHAASLGDGEAHREVGLFMAAGIHPPHHNATDKTLFRFGSRHWPKAMVHLYLAASMNDSLAQMALGYRYAHGLGVPKSCSSAVLYYQAVAERVTDMARFPYNFPRVERILLSAHGSRASFPSREQELLHYQWFADMGYVDAQRAVGRLLASGGPEMADKALHYFRQAADAGDADAMAHLGHIHMNGIGVAASNTSAIKWFRMGSERGNPSAHFGLGYMYLRGQGLPQDYRMALKYFTAAAEQAYREAWFQLGMMHLHGLGVPMSLQQAQSFLGLASKAGHVMAQYNLAMIYLRTSSQTHCELALNRLKAVAERGPWSNGLQEASQAFSEGRHDQALLQYLKLSEAGYELAQTNAAWMLGRDHGLPAGQSAKAFVKPGTEPSSAALTALRSHQRASQQGNVESTLAIGDAFYYGKGVLRDWPKAFQVYTAAARFRNAQAHFNLGFMHEYGAGVPEDLALAKRNYDKAKEYLPGAAAPVQAALLSLWLHSWWNYFKPYYPSSLSWLWGGIFSLREPSRVMSPVGSYLPKPGFAGLDKLLEVFWVASPITKVLFQIFVRPFQNREGLLLHKADVLETTMLLLLIGCLWMVVWRRMRIRSRRQHVPPPAPGPPPPPPAERQQAQTDQGPVTENSTVGQVPSELDGSSGTQTPAPPTQADAGHQDGLSFALRGSEKVRRKEGEEMGRVDIPEQGERGFTGAKLGSLPRQMGASVSNVAQHSRHFASSPWNNACVEVA